MISGSPPIRDQVRPHGGSLDSDERDDRTDGILALPREVHRPIREELGADDELDQAGRGRRGQRHT